ncbi:MAG: hypothetical protein RLZZ292_2814 [Bacteroidota bacterium]|jgi:hypothetical protein
MQAIEFETFITHSAIKIPLQFQNLDNLKAKVIVLFSEPEPKKEGNYDKGILLLAFSRAQQKGIFKSISNSVTWQKQLRDEWE